MEELKRWGGWREAWFGRDGGGYMKQDLCKGRRGQWISKWREGKRLQRPQETGVNVG